jgi:hypothetical protein
VGFEDVGDPGALAISDVDIDLAVATRIDDGCLALITEDVG